MRRARSRRGGTCFHCDPSRRWFGRHRVRAGLGVPVAPERIRAARHCRRAHHVVRRFDSRRLERPDDRCGGLTLHGRACGRWTSAGQADVKIVVDIRRGSRERGPGGSGRGRDRGGGGRSWRRRTCRALQCTDRVGRQREDLDAAFDGAVRQHDRIGAEFGLECTQCLAGGLGEMALHVHLSVPRLRTRRRMVPIIVGAADPDRVE